MSKSIKKLFRLASLAAFLATTFTHGANAATVRRNNEFLGPVTIQREDLPAWRQFVPHLERAMDVARVIGVTELPVRRTNFSGETMHPGFSVSGRVLNIGSLPPRRADNFRAYNLVSLHEIGHAVLLQALANKKGIPYMTFFSEYMWIFGTDIMGPFEEFFADAFAQLILNDPTGISLHIWTSNTWYNRLPVEERERWAVQSGTHDLETRGLWRRDFTGPESRRCSPQNPTTDLWFDSARRTLWTEIFTRRNHQSADSIPMILAALVDYADHLLMQTTLNRAAIQSYSELPPPQTNFERLTRPIPLRDLPEDYFDFHLRDFLRARFR